MADQRSLEEIDLENRTSAKTGDGKSMLKTKQASTLQLFKRRKVLIIAGVAFLVIAAVLGLVLGLTLKGKKEEEPSAPEVVYEDLTDRLDCLPWAKTRDIEFRREECLKLKDMCKFQEVKNDTSVPVCYYDKKAFKQQVIPDSVSDTDKKYFLELKPGQPRLNLHVQYLEDTVLRFKIGRDGDYEVPYELNKPTRKAKNPKYEFSVAQVEGLIQIKVTRKSTGTVLWDTTLGPMIYDDLHREISTKLPSKNIYGLGENKHKRFKHELNYQNWPVWARDEGPENYDNGNLYGSQPFYTCMEEDGKSHGVLLYNSNAFEYELIPNPGLVYRLTGGILDFYVFLGPEPENVVQQFTQYVGRTFMPPYWALGFQISRYGYKDLADMKAVLERFQQHDIPLDTQVADIDHYDERKDFTIDEEKWKELPEYFEYLHSIGMKTVMIVDPALVVNETDYWPFETGKENNVFITWPGESPDFEDTNSNIMLGYCWPKGKVAYPDYFKKSTQKWWVESIERHYQKLKFDGLWIDMNEPAVFGTNEERPFNWPEDAKPYWSLKCPDDKYELVKTKASYLYKDTNKLSDKTLCMTAVQGENNEYKHFDVHNLYGFSESIPTFEAARKIAGTRGFSITRSTFIGSGKYGGHWTGDNHSLWSHLYYSIIGMLEFNLFGISYVGADICGFFLDTNKELCARWSQLGAFYPFSRNHNSIDNIDQDPVALGEPVITAAKRALDVRYEILPYYYTLFFKSHSFGNTVVRPLFHEYPLDPETRDIDAQFLVGPAFLVTPVLTENSEEVTGYFPPDNWYSYYDGSMVHSVNPEDNTPKGKWVDIDAPIQFIPLHIRGGYIIPTQEKALTTEASRKNKLGLIVAPNEDGEAQGDLFYDDGLSQDIYDKYFFGTFSLRDNKLKMNIEHNTYFTENSTLEIDTIRIFTDYWKNVDFNKMTFYVAQLFKLKPSQIEVQLHQVILKNLKFSLTSTIEIDWSLDDQKFFTVDIREEVVSPVIDCSIQNASITEEACKAKKCAYNPKHIAAPKCYVPPTVGGYRVMQTMETDQVEIRLQKYDTFSLIEKELKDLVLKVSYGAVPGTDGKHKLTRIKIYDPANERFEVPVPLNFENSDKDGHLMVKLEDAEREGLFSFTIINADNEPVLSNKGAEHGFVYADQFIQIVLQFASYSNTYGFGENTHSSFRHTYDHENWWGVFARDQPTGYDGLNAYGTHPFIMAVSENTGRAFGMLILNSNAQEYGFIPYNTFSYRTLGGLLDIYMIEEATPELLIQTYTQLIGRPYLPPYWALGFQLSRYGYNSLEKLRAAVTRTLDAKIPLDIQYADIDHFRKQLDFTYDEVNFKGLPEYIDELKTKGVRFIIILDPAIDSEEPNYQPFIEGTQADAWIKWPADNNPQKDEINGDNPYMVGYVWPEGKTVFPDFFKNRTKAWWKKQIHDHYQNTLKFDGLWIDMNEPANFDTNEEKPWNWPASRPPWNLKCPVNTYDDPPFLSIIAQPFGNVKRMSDKTLCMIARQGENDEYMHYDVHNLFGWSQTEITLNSLREVLNRRSIVITRSTFVSSGTHAGHWLGDNISRWSHLKFNIIGMLESNLFGIPYIGADICGFFGDATPEMCTRWMQLGAFNTFFRNHNGLEGVDQDPAALGPDVAAASREIIDIRYSFLPYLYSLFYHANQNGGTVIRSLVHEFSKDLRAADIDRQFMWGSAILLSPVLDRNRRTVYAYFPQNERWYDYYDGHEVQEVGRMHELHAPLDHMPIHIRGGRVILTQHEGINTIENKKNPFSLIVTMPVMPNPMNDTVEIDSFNYFFDDGDEIDYNTLSTIVQIKYTIDDGREHVLDFIMVKENFPVTSRLETVRFLGVPSTPSYIEIDDGVNTPTPHNAFEYNEYTKVLAIEATGLAFNGANKRITIRI